MEAEKDDSRKDAKHAKFGEIRGYFSLRPWRLGGINFLEMVLFSI
jgi:hypothetical protein